MTLWPTLLRHLRLQKISLATIVTAAALVHGAFPSVATAQYRYPTFGLPSSAFSTRNPRPQGQVRQSPQNLSPSQTATARRLPATPSNNLQRVAHQNESAPTATPPQEPARFGGPVREYGRPLPLPSGLQASSAAPIQQASNHTSERRTLFGIFSRDRGPSETSSNESSVRRESTAQPQQSPPRHDAAVDPTDGRTGLRERFQQVFDWDRSSPDPLPTRPPVEPQPYRPPTTQPHRLPPLPPLQQSTEARPTQQRYLVPPRHAQAINAPQRAPETRSTFPAATTDQYERKAAASAEPADQDDKQSRVVARFEIMPLTEPVLAPPAEETWDRNPGRRADVASGRYGQASSEDQVATERTGRQVAAHASESDSRLSSSRQAVSDVPRLQPNRDSPYLPPRLLPEMLPETSSGHTPSNDDVFRKPVRQTTSDAVAVNRPKPSTIEVATPQTEIPTFPNELFPEDRKTTVETEESLELDEEWSVATELQVCEPRQLSTAETEYGSPLKGTRMQQIVSRPGNGLKGFCPVALRDRRTLEDGRVAFTSRYGGRTYFFSSAEAKAAFDDNPTRYAPAAHGIDVMLAAITGEIHEGSLDHAVWYKDRLYLFETAENLKTFMALPSAMDVAE